MSSNASIAESNAESAALDVEIPDHPVDLQHGGWAGKKPSDYVKQLGQSQQHSSVSVDMFRVNKSWQDSSVASCGSAQVDNDTFVLKDIGQRFEVADTSGDPDRACSAQTTVTNESLVTVNQEDEECSSTPVDLGQGNDVNDDGSALHFDDSLINSTDVNVIHQKCSQEVEETKEESSSFESTELRGETNTQENVDDEENKAKHRVVKLLVKRRRNHTLDYHDLAPTAFAYNGQVAKYVQKTYINQELQASTTGNTTQENCNAGTVAMASGEHHQAEAGLGQGLGIILDKLRNIETKLDEIKSMEQNVWYPDVEGAANLPMVGATPTKLPPTSDNSQRNEEKK